MYTEEEFQKILSNKVDSQVRINKYEKSYTLEFNSKVGFNAEIIKVYDDCIEIKYYKPNDDGFINEFININLLTHIIIDDSLYEKIT